jgi:AcrR family transcriptional regulator
LERSLYTARVATTRDRIIVACNELFRRQGYNGTSLSQISAASGATIGSIYHFFPGGKEALAVSVIDTTAGVYRELFVSIAAEAKDPTQAFVDFFSGAAAVLAESDYIDPCPIGGIAREVANVSEPLRIAAAQAFESWIRAAQDHLIIAGVPRRTASELATVFVAMVEGTFVLSRAQRTGDVLTAAGKHMTELTRQAIAQQPTQARSNRPTKARTTR